jgi:Holliday junction resolvase-like predicted endonuclease
MAKKTESRFSEDVRRGRRFEAEERAGWRHIARQNIAFEAATAWGPKRGRIDIKIDEDAGYIAIVEIKATDWDRLKRDRIRATARRHSRQIWRYVDDHVENQGKEVCPALVYEYEPSDARVRAEVEQVLNDCLIQVVWRKGQHP